MMNQALGIIQRNGVANTLEGDVGELAWLQATTACNRGGLGLRSAAELALPAFIASRTASRPGALHLFKRIEEAGLAAAAVLTQAYDRRTDAAVSKLSGASGGHATEVQAFETIISNGARAAAEWWDNAQRGDSAATDARNLVGEDDEVDDTTRTAHLRHASEVQKHLTQIIDSVKLSQLRQRYEADGSAEDVSRLDDLMDIKNQGGSA